jgi:ribosomal protein L18
MVNSQFAQKHPELLEASREDDIHNAEAIAKILMEYGWTYNLNNLEAAYAVAKTQGKLKLEAAPSMVSDLTGSPNPPTEEQVFAHRTTRQSELELKFPSGKLCWGPLLRRQQK